MQYTDQQVRVWLVRDALVDGQWMLEGSEATVAASEARRLFDLGAVYLPDDDKMLLPSRSRGGYLTK